MAFSCPDDVAYFIANRVKSNIRELEGPSSASGPSAPSPAGPCPSTSPRRSWPTSGGRGQRPVTLEDILRRVGEVLPRQAPRPPGQTRTKAVAFPRQVAMYLARQLTSESYAEIGRGFGGKDHTTVLHAVNKVEAAVSSRIRSSGDARPHHQHHSARVSGVVLKGTLIRDRRSEP